MAISKVSILYKLIEGADAGESYGLPTSTWELLTTLTQEVYGNEGVALVNSYHKVYDAGVDSRSECNHHTIQGSEEGGYFKVTPEIIIARLKVLKTQKADHVSLSSQKECLAGEAKALPCQDLLR